MRLPPVRFTVRRLMIVVALASIALALIGVALRDLRVYDFYFTIGRPGG